MDTPKIPTLKDSQKPQVKVRGLEAGVTLFDRLKQFKKKDLAFILAGLGTLFMAPLAEHFMMSPESGDGTLQQGTRGKGFFDGSGSNPYEAGSNNGMAPGGPVGGGSDIITPLNVRDPSALVMGPGATQQPPAGSPMPSTPPPTAPVTHSDSDLRDALAAGGRAAASAVKKALLPIPKIALAGSGGLRGLGVANGGSNASAGPISSAGLVSGKSAGGSNMAGVRGGNNIKSVTRGAAGGDGDDKMNALKKAADAAAGLMNRGGAAAALEEAAKAGIPTGGGGALGGAGGGSGSTDKAAGGDQNKDGKNVGESLAFLKAKAIQEAQIDLWKKEQEAGDMKLEAEKIRNTTAETFASTLAGDLAKKLSACLTKGFNKKDCMLNNPGVANYYCGDGGIIPAEKVADSFGECGGKVAKGKDNADAADPKVYYITNDGSFPSGDPAKPNLIRCNPQSGGKDLFCQADGNVKKGDKSKPDDPNGKSAMGGMTKSEGGIGAACSTLQSIATQFPKSATASSIDAFVAQAAKYVALRDAAHNSDKDNKYVPTKDCGNAATKPWQLTLRGQLIKIADNSKGDNVLLKDLHSMGDLTAKTDPGNDLKALSDSVVGTDQASGISKDIQDFTDAAKAVNDEYHGLSLGPEPTVDAGALQKGGFSMTDKTIPDQVKKAAEDVRQATLDIGTPVGQMFQAATIFNKAPTAVKMLQDSVAGKQSPGTISQVITTNKSYDDAAKELVSKDSSQKPLDPGDPNQVVPKAPDQNADPLTAVNKAIGDAKQPLADATKAIADLKGTPPPAEAVAAAKKLLDLAAIPVSTARAGQISVEEAISNDAREAMGQISK